MLNFRGVWFIFFDIYIYLYTYNLKIQKVPTPYSWCKQSGNSHGFMVFFLHSVTPMDFRYTVYHNLKTHGIMVLSHHENYTLYCWNSRLFWDWVFPYISRIHTAYIGEDSSISGAWNVWWSLVSGGAGCVRVNLETVAPLEKSSQGKPES